jgi:uncharacterized protein (TIGR03437 family)
VVVPDSFGPSYYWLLPRGASGAHVVSLLVSDGFRSTQSIWHLNVVPGKKPTILFDDTHSERNTINPERALKMNPQHPEWVSFGEFATYLAPSYQVSSLTSGPITSAALGGVDVFVLAAPDAALSADENLAVKRFVDSGGSLVYMGDAWLNSPNNSLLATWGIQFDPAIILSPSASVGCPGCFPLKTFTYHHALGNNPAYAVGNAGSFAISGQAMSLGRTGAAEWRSRSGQPPQQPGEPNGPFTTIAVSGSGAGKVFALSDNGFYDQFFDAYPNNVALLSSALAWLTSGAGSPAPSFTAILNSGSYTSGVSPGSWATIFGQNLSNLPAAGRSWAPSDFNGSNLPLSLSGTSVLINKRPAAVSFVSPTQLNVQVPDLSDEATVSVVVTAPAGTVAGTAILKQLAPSLFTIPLNGTAYAAAVGLDGAYIGPPGQLPGGRAAGPGEVIEIFGTGFGPGIPSQPAGMMVNAVPLSGAVSASICGQAAIVGYAGLVGPGLNQFNVAVPNVPTGPCAITLTVNGLPTQSGVVVPIGP